MPAPLPPIVRFVRHIQVDPVSGCWVWTGTTAGTKGRYPTFQPGTTNLTPKGYAHRWAYEYFVGPIPEGYELDHVKDWGCITNLCVKPIADLHGPAHLEPVTAEENNRRKRLAVCRSGRHNLSDPANVQWDDKGRRRGCIICHREKALNRYYVRKCGRTA